MASGWMKSLHCKSTAFDDVVPNQYRRRHRSASHSSSCKNGVRSLKDIVETTTNKPKPPKQPQTPPFRRNASTVFPWLTELAEGHPSRNVVEIIFQSSWEEKSFSGRVELVFKVQNLTRMLARFEEYREMVKSRARSSDTVAGEEDHGRCVADGNEVMRFYCLGATTGGGAFEAGYGTWGLCGGKSTAVCTYSGSGVAHEKAGGGRGRRAMLVCRVISGRIFTIQGMESQSLGDNRVGYDSVCGENGELTVVDSRALLPCFLIIYKL